MSAGNLTDEDLKEILALPGLPPAIKAKIEADLPAPPPAEPFKLERVTLASGETAVKVVAAPGPVAFALCPTEQGGTATKPPLYEPKAQPVGAIVKGKPGYEWIDAKVEGASEWWSKQHGRIHVELPAPVEPPPKEKPTEEPKPGASSVGYRAGCSFGGWTRSQEVADAKKLGGKPIVRLENPSEIESFTSQGVAVIVLNSGGTHTGHLSDEGRAHRDAILRGEKAVSHRELQRLGYSTGGVKSLDLNTVVAAAVSNVEKHPTMLVLEELNEPGGPWFWGSGAESEANAAAYAKIGRAVAEALDRKFGAKAPIVALSFDGGHAGNNAWGKAMLKADPTLFQHRLIFPTMHPYDGSGASPDSTLVRWPAVEEAHRLTGKWPLITEYGRPLLASTGDSPRSTEAQQAKADGAMAAKCKTVETIYTAYGGRGDSAPCYAIFTAADKPRLAVSAIAAA